MSTEIKNFYDLIVWKKAHELVVKIYKITQTFPDNEKYGITSQIRRAAASITANIAEGFERFHCNDKIKFYHYARASCGEVQNFLFISKDIKIITAENFNDLFSRAQEIGKLINGLINSVQEYKNHFN